MYMRIIKIGSDTNNDMIISGDPAVSRMHMQLFIDDEANVFVTDCNSTNGTYVNGQRIDISIKLETYDILRIANTLINWQQLLLDNVDVKEAYETFQDNSSIPELQLEPQKNKSVKLLLFIVSILIVGIVIYLICLK
jgi:pSer/pThr/pTyr-binding forkhead associated (FHA) protein